jgi:hypothetical protein
MVFHTLEPPVTVNRKIGMILMGAIWTDEAANIASVIAAVVAILGLLGGLFIYLRRGPKVSIEIIPPHRNRKNRAPTDRRITVSVSNHCDALQTSSSNSQVA